MGKGNRIKAIIIKSAIVVSVPINANSFDWVEKCKPVENKIDELERLESFSSATVNDIFKTFNQYTKCRDGLYAEGYTDIVVKSLKVDLTDPSQDLCVS